MKRKRHFENISTDDFRAELRREKYKQRYHHALRNTILTLVVVAAFAVLASTLWFPVMRIFGSSMTPTLQEGEIVVAIKTNTFQAGDIVGFYYGNKLLVKRYIAGPGDWVNITDDGTVYVNDVKLDEMMSSSMNRTWRKKLWATAILICRCRCLRDDTSLLETIEPHPWILEIL